MAYSPEDRNEATTTRRMFLRGSAVAALLAVSPKLGAYAATKTTKKTTKTTKKAAATTAVPTTAATTTAPATTAPAAKAAAGALFDTAKELVVTYTFSADSGRVRNPYTAVWIEHADGTLVRTLEVTVQLGKGLRWLPDLKRWFRADQDRLNRGGADFVQTMSTATRLPGTYSVAWDGHDDQKATVAQGEYVVCIEAARERGPYELIRETITVGDAPFTKQLTPSGELTAASVELRARK